MNKNEWQKTQAIHMTIQSADFHHIGIKSDKELNISCGLLNIARGQCNLRIFPNHFESLKKIYWQPAYICRSTSNDR